MLKSEIDECMKALNISSSNGLLSSQPLNKIAHKSQTSPVNITQIIPKEGE